jgi:dextranase
VRGFIWILLAFIIFLQGGSVIAVNVSLAPDKAYYKPGDMVRLVASAAEGATLEVTITHLRETVATLSAPVKDGKAEVDWTPPKDAPRGYGADARLLDANGKLIATASTAFDVLENWIQAPRYGFLTEFGAGRNDAAETMERLVGYHINGLQFYDWQYRHDTLMPPTEEYADVLGRPLSMKTVRALIDAAHARNIAAMPYTAIYGASWAFFLQHKDWALFQYGGEPYKFGDNFLAIMDPTSGSPWAEHLLKEFGDVLDNTAFDGIHIDQYGSPKRGLDKDGKLVDLEKVFPAFVDASKDVVNEKRGKDGVVIFNLVGNWPVKTVAPSKEDAVYIEVWPPLTDFMDLHRVVAGAQALGGNKPVIIAAYVPPEREANVRLANAVIFASGGYSIELGEPNALLADPYFPKFGLMSPELSAALRRDYDFIVRYQNVLSSGTTNSTPERGDALTLDGIDTNPNHRRDTVKVIARKGNGFETFSLVNMLGLKHTVWTTPLPNPPTTRDNLPAKLYVTGEVKGLWMASPDGDIPGAAALDFTSGKDEKGAYITFTVPRLDYWTMLVVQY